MSAQSVEMMATLKNPSRYSMTETERLQAMGQANDNVIKALQLCQEADRLIQEASRPWRALIAISYCRINCYIVFVAAGGFEPTSMKMLTI